VKRELVSLKREHYELLDRIEQQESEIHRAQSQLEGLERLLTDPLAAANAMVYFQLRHLWRVGVLKMEQFARELKVQRQSRERTQLHNAVLAKRSRRQQAIEAKLEELSGKRQQTIRECQASEQRLAGMNFVLKLFAGRALRNRIQAMRSNREALEERIREFNDIIEKIQAEPLPDPEGLSLESRKVINVAIISLAQHMVLQFAEHDLARLARKASKRSVGDMQFGDRSVCDEMVERVRVRVQELNRDSRLADMVKHRADLLMNDVQYRHETDATPMRSSLSEIQRIPDALYRNAARRSAGAPLRVNVLQDDYWELSRNLL
jgi:hypothetical protein